MAKFNIAVRLTSTGRMSTRVIHAVDTANAIAEGVKLGKVYSVARVVAMNATELTTV